MELITTPFAYVAAISLSAIGVASAVHLCGWFFAPERIIPYFDK